MVCLDFPFLLLNLFGMWLPGSLDTKKGKIIYSLYRNFIGIMNVISLICESIFIVNSISFGLKHEYNEVLFLSICGVVALFKYWVFGAFMRKDIESLQNLFCQRTFQPEDKSEIKLEEKYEKWIKYSENLL